MITSMIKFIISQFNLSKSASSVARENNISVSTMLRLWNKISVHNLSLAHIISIDRFRKRIIYASRKSVPHVKRVACTSL